MKMNEPDRRFHALILMGVSGSGKSTIAAALSEKLHWPFEDGDAFHPKSNVEKMRAGIPLSDDDRWPWLQAIADEIARKRAIGQSIIIACSALKRVYRNILVAGHHDVRIVYLQGSKHLIAARLAARKGHFMPPDLLDSQFKTLEEPKADENPVIADISASVADIVDQIMSRLRQPASERNL